jgi:hypothetical protein
MNRLGAAAREVLGLFIEDSFLTIAVLLWLAVCGLLAPRLGIDPRIAGVLIFAGCAAILLTSTAKATREATVRRLPAASDRPPSPDRARPPER